MSGLWECAECAQENEASDETCIACEEPRPSQDADGDSNDKYSGYKVAQILTVEDVPGKLKLRVVQLDLGGGADKAIKVVTNAPNVSVGARVVVATVGAKVSDASGDEIAIKKQAVGGVMSEGMLCDSAMLGWSGGGAGVAALVPDSCALGSRPPEKRPRLDGK